MTQTARLQAEAVREVELEGHTLVIKRIHVTYRFSPARRWTARQWTGSSASTPTTARRARSIGGNVDITTWLEYV